MQILAMQLVLLWTLALAPAPTSATSTIKALTIAHAIAQQSAPAAKQLLAVRGEVVKSNRQGRRMLLITIKPAKEFAEVTVLADENDLVGSAPRRTGDVDLFSMLSDDERDSETITAAELSAGDVVSIIYDPQLQNRALEIYLH